MMHSVISFTHPNLDFSSPGWGPEEAGEDGLKRRARQWASWPVLGGRRGPPQRQGPRADPLRGAVKPQPRSARAPGRPHPPRRPTVVRALCVDLGRRQDHALARRHGLKRRRRVARREARHRIGVLRRERHRRGFATGRHPSAKLVSGPAGVDTHMLFAVGRPRACHPLCRCEGSPQVG